MKLYVLYGSDARTMAHRLMEESGLRPEQSARIAIKPNLVVPRPWQEGATTNPDTVAGIIEYLHGIGCRDIAIIEGSGVGRDTTEAFRVCGYERLRDEYGVELIDIKHGAFRRMEFGGYAMKVAESIYERDVIINVPLIKGHCQTSVTCALKNMKGLISEADKRAFHTMGLHKPIAAMGALLRPALTIADGIVADIDFEQGGNPVRMNTMVACADPVLLDCYASRMLGYPPEEIEYIRLSAAHGLGSMELRDEDIVVLNKPDAGIDEIPRSRIVNGLKKYVDDVDACSVCYGALMHALRITGGFREKIGIGQGYRGQSGNIGVGNCTRAFAHSCPGCPPAAADIIEFLRALE